MSPNHYIPDEFRTLLKRIEGGESVDDSELLPFLALESKSDRYRVNHALAAAYYDLHERKGCARALRLARSCGDRALLLSEYSPEVLPTLVRIYRAQADAAAYKEALKRAGIEQAAGGNFDEALKLFDRWIYAHAAVTNIDTQSFDADIVACVERMTLLHRFDVSGQSRRPGGKIRLAYLMQGLTQVNSVLVRIDETFARLHDRSRFEVAYFTVEDEEAVAASPYAQAAVRNIQAHGWGLHVPPKGETLFEQLLSVGRRIHDFAPDLLVTTGALTTFKNYFVACLRPAPLALALHQGSTALFTWHSFDHSISWFLTNLLDCPADCSHVPLEFDLPEREEVPAASREELDIPAGSTVAVSGGRWQKFQGSDFWRAVSALLLEHPGLYWLVVGISEDRMPSLTDLLAPEARSRIRFRGWGHDYLRYLTAADVFVDSYPVGGGMLLMEAMGLGLPVVSFENDYVAAYDDNDSSGGTEVVGIPELLVRRGDFVQLKSHISALVADEGYRRRLGQACYERVRRRQADPSRMVRRCEEVYGKVLAQRNTALGVSAATSSAGNPPGAESGGGGQEDYRRSLIEQSHVLSRREAELNRRAALHRERFLLRAERALRWRWRRLTGREYLGYPE